MSDENNGITLNYQLYFPLAVVGNTVDVVFPCPQCYSKLRLRPADDSVSDISCPTCGGVFTLCGCGKCKAVFGLTPLMRDDLRQAGSVACPICKVELISFSWPRPRVGIFEIDGKPGYELLLPQSSKNQRFMISVGSALVFNCFGCKAELKKVGALHEDTHCGQCGACNYLVGCPNCAQLFPVDCEKREDLSTAISCPCCEAYLIWPASYVEISGTSTRSLRKWSDDVREGNYLLRSEAVLGDPEKRLLAVYHTTTGVRAAGAEYHLAQLQRIELKTFRIVADGEGASDVTNNDNSVFSQEVLLDVCAFGFINSLRSSLDILTQELAVLFSLTAPESDIDFSLRRVRGSLPSAVEDQILAFQATDEYMYLNKLRNAVQHRRIWLEHTKSIFNTHAVTGEAEPVQVEIFLPDQPNDLPGTQTYTQGKELITTFRSLLGQVRDFIFNIYELAAQIK